VSESSESAILDWTRCDRRRLISPVFEDGECRFDQIIRHEQLHACYSAFHARTYADDDRGYFGCVQCDPRQIGLDRRGRLGGTRYFFLGSSAGFT
jgi:hypothetical protein